MTPVRSSSSIRRGWGPLSPRLRRAHRHGPFFWPATSRTIWPICFSAVGFIYAGDDAPNGAQPLKSHCMKAPVTVRILRVDFGDWTGLTWGTSPARFGISAYQWLDLMDKAALPRCESAQTFPRGIEPAFREIIGGHAGGRRHRLSRRRGPDARPPARSAQRWRASGSTTPA